MSRTSLNSIALEIEREKSLDEIFHSVKFHAFHMKKSLKQNKVADALPNAQSMLSELRCSLSPKMYYELYMLVFDELSALREYLKENFANVALPSPKENQTIQINVAGVGPKHKLEELYESVQLCPYIVPRLYLMITVGHVYMSAQNSAKKDLMYDMLDMCKGVQHPTRGLFLRYYLQQMTKDYPDSDVDTWIEFLLQNFSEMNKLWVRLQHQGLMKDREKREQERKDLRLLVGANLLRLSQFEISLEIYRTKILPQILEQIISCKDTIAQDYLMEALIQVYPDEFHLHSLTELLEATGQLSPRVNIKNIISTFINRLSDFAKSEEGKLPENINLFMIFWNQISNLITIRPDMSLDDISSLLVSLLKLALSYYLESYQYVIQIFNFVTSSFAGKEIDAKTGKNLVELVKLCLGTYSSLLVILTQTDFSESLVNFVKICPFPIRHSIGLNVIQHLLDKTLIISDPDHVNVILGDLCSTLVKDQKDGIKTSADSDNLIAKAFSLFVTEDLDKQFIILFTARKHFQEGGSLRMKLNIPPLVEASLALASKYEENDERLLTLFKFVFQTIAVLEKSKHYELSLSLYLSPFKERILFGHETIAYEFIVQAFTLYEENIVDSKLQLEILNKIMSVLIEISNSGIFSNENYENLCTKCTLYCSRLLKKQDQCKMIASSAKLFWARDATDLDIAQIVKLDGPREKWIYREEKKCLECLQRSLKIADSCMDLITSSDLFVDILDVYVFFFQKGNTAVVQKYLNSLIELIHSNLSSFAEEESVNVFKIQKKFLASLLKLSDYRKEALADAPPRYAGEESFASSVQDEERRRWEGLIVEDIAKSVEKWLKEREGLLHQVDNSA